MSRKRPLTSEEERLWRTVMKDAAPIGRGGTVGEPIHTPHHGPGHSSMHTSGGLHTSGGKTSQQKPHSKLQPKTQPGATASHIGHPPPPKKTSRAALPIIRHPAPASGRAAPPGQAGTPDDLSNLDRKSRQRVRRGKVDIDAKIDLHGMRQSEAHQALIARVSHARADGARVLLVVTGKGASKGGPSDGSEPFWARGGGILKAQVPNWLREDPLRSMIFSVQQAHQYHGGSGALYVFLKRVR